MSNSSSKNNPIVITDSNGKKRTIQIVTLIGSNGEIIDFTDNSIDVNMTNGGIVDVNNSTTDVLGSGGYFEGSATEIKDYGIIYITTKSDVASAIDGLSVEQSTDGINWDHSDKYTITANSGKTFSFQAGAQFFRIVYTNGSTIQGFFRLQTILKKINGKPSSHRLKDIIVNDDDAELVKSVIAVQTIEPDIYANVDVQNPLPADGDSVYAKDLLLDLSNQGNFIITDNPSASKIEILSSMVSDVHVEKKDDTSNNPKSYTLTFKRPVSTSSFGIDSGPDGDFSNTKITIFKGQSSEVIIDESLDNTKHDARLFPISPVKFSKILIEFYTDDTVTTGLTGIFKNTEVAARIQGIAPSGIVKDVAVTVDGNLSISDNSSGLSIAKGDVEGTTFIHKFGNAPDFDNADGFIAVWDGANDSDIAEMHYTYSIDNLIGFISSSSVADTQDIEIQGLYDDGTGNWLLHVQTVSLTGQTKSVLAQPLIRVFRMKNMGDVDISGLVYCYEDDNPVGGVPPNTDRVRAVINGDNNQTLMALYTVPSGKTAYMRNWFASTAGANKTTNYVIDVKARPFGGVFQLKHRSAISENGNSLVQHIYEEPEIFSEKTDVEIRASALAVGVTSATIAAGFDMVLIDNE